MQANESSLWSGTRKRMPESFNQVPEVTLAFWIIRIAATTPGETGGDTVLPQWAGEHPGQPEMVRKYKGLLVRRL
jgi:hypothetical protein